VALNIVETEREKQPPPGTWAWGVTIGNMLCPALALIAGIIGIQDRGNDIKLGWFISSFVFMVVGLILSMVAHFWGLAKAFYPSISKSWLTVCLLGIVGGIGTLVVGVYLLIRINGAGG
jgi:hypothetical protein